MLQKVLFHFSKHRRRLSLRSNLILLVLVSMTPLLLFSAAIVFHLSRANRETFERGATQRTLALMTAIDTELKESITTFAKKVRARWVEIMVTSTRA